MEAFLAVDIGSVVLRSAGIKLFLAVLAREALLVIHVLFEQDSLRGVHSFVAILAFVASTTELCKPRIRSPRLLLGNTSFELFLTISTTFKAQRAVHFLFEHGAVAWVAFFGTLRARQTVSMEDLLVVRDRLSGVHSLATSGTRVATTTKL
jgi:hypothetical protein